MEKTASFFPYTKELENSSRRDYIAYYGGGTLRYQEEVKAALQRVTSWIGQALGIENGDTDFYTNVVGKSISRDGITITLNEIVMDSKNLWIAYSDSED